MSVPDESVRKLAILIPVSAGGSTTANCLANVCTYAPRTADVFLLDGSACPNEICAVYERWQAEHCGLQYIRTDVNSSSELCQWAHRRQIIENADVLILGPTVLLEPDTVGRLLSVLKAHEKHAIVIPRSNAPLGFSRIPLIGPALAPQESKAIWRAIRERLSLYQIVPSVVGNCALIRKEILAHFGLGEPGEDLTAFSLRINRYGYSTVLANQAFVETAVANEAPADLSEYLEREADPIDYFGSLKVPHRPRILYDLWHLAPHYYGTAEFGLNLLRALQVAARDEFDIFIDIQPAAHEFFKAELYGYPRHQADRQYDLVFTPTQINSWNELHRINLTAPRIAYTVLDLIAVRCQYLSFPGKSLLFRKCFELCDQAFTLSESAASDFAALTDCADRPLAIHLATKFGVDQAERILGNYVLLIGNAYTHKALREALRVIAAEDIPIVVVGLSDASKENMGEHVRYFESGNITPEALREVLAGSRMLVYPSHYEGFGLPVTDALALGKPVIALDNAMGRELLRLTEDPNLHLVKSLTSISDLLRKLWESATENQQRFRSPRRWNAVAEEYLEQFRLLISRDIDTERMRERWTFLRTRCL